VDREQLAFLLAGLIAASLISIVVALASRSLRKRAAGRRARRRANRAVAGEHEAEGLLTRAGYQIDARQAQLTWTFTCDDSPLEVELRADLLVTREGRRYVAEVKTGELAPQLTNASTRRQLLEYRVAYDVDGALLVDMESERVTEVEFPLPSGAGIPPRRPRRVWRAAVASALAAAAVSASLTRWLLQ